MTIHPFRLAVAALPVLAVLAPWTGAQAASYPSFSPAPGAYDVDTTAMTITGPGTSITGVDRNGVAVFRFADVAIPSGATLTAHGSRPLELSATGTMVVSGTIDGAGRTAERWGEDDAPGGPGGGTGLLRESRADGGPGLGGWPGDGEAGAGGGGFGGAGARGGSDTSNGGAAGSAYGDLARALQGGSGGVGDFDEVSSGGGGGGGVELLAEDLTVDGTITVDGGDGTYGDLTGTGGGSGGGILLRARHDLVQTGTLSATGGAGGDGGYFADPHGGAGGGGGGGRVLLVYGHSVDSAGTVTTAGGLSGVGSGPASPDVSGADGTSSVTQGVDDSVASVRAAFDAITYGRKVAVSTVLTDTTTGDPIGGGTVSLYRRTSPAGAWALVGTRTTTSTGRAGIADTPHATADYQWRYAGDADHSPVDGDTTTVHVAQSVYAHATDGTVTHSAAAAFHVYGWVQPAGTGQRVYLQRRSGTSWVAAGNQLLKNQKLPSGTTRVGYNFTVRAPKAGTFTYRVYKPATTTLDKAYSASQTFTVK